MAIFQCKKCKYKFTPRGDQTALPRRCPYCATEGSVMRQVPADDLIKNVDNMFDL